jgi:hypothetical protein
LGELFKGGGKDEFDRPGGYWNGSEKIARIVAQLLFVVEKQI